MRCREYLLTSEDSSLTHWLFGLGGIKCSYAARSIHNMCLVVVYLEINQRQSGHLTTQELRFRK
jgi:hypothetical protein